MMHHDLGLVGTVNCMVRRVGKWRECMLCVLATTHARLLRLTLSHVCYVCMQDLYARMLCVHVCHACMSCTHVLYACTSGMRVCHVCMHAMHHRMSYSMHSTHVMCSYWGLYGSCWNPLAPFWDPIGVTSALFWAPSGVIKFPFLKYFRNGTFRF